MNQKSVPAMAEFNQINFNRKKMLFFGVLVIRIKSKLKRFDTSVKIIDWNGKFLFSITKCAKKTCLSQINCSLMNYYQNNEWHNKKIFRPMRAKTISDSI